MVDCDKLMVLLKMYQLGPDQYGILGTDTDANIMEQENSNIKYTVMYIYIYTVYILYIYAILADCSFKYLLQIYVLEAGYLTFFKTSVH